ncbi:MAG: OFA family MFS transporter [Leptospirales bacterium]|nr:OFA family MFS transporter [Leptospirales bacterium]
MSANLDSKRWLIAAMGTCLQICLGTAYAWSYFQGPLSSAFEWSQSLTAWAFCLAICSLGIAAAIGGVLLPKVGPRKLAVTGGILFALGYLTGALALKYQSAPLLFLTYSVIGGFGLGAGYVTPVATVAKWFPDKKGLATGLVVMGFGLGALFMSKIFAPMLFNYFDWTAASDAAAQQAVLVNVFLALGVIFLVLTIPIGSMLQNPPADYVPAGYTPPAVAAAASGSDISAKERILSGRFFLMWLIFFCNITAGIAIIGFQSPLFQELWAKYFNIDINVADNKTLLAAYGGTLIAITSIFNGLGRFFWGGLSDKIGRIQTFRIMLGTQILAFIAIAYVGNPWIFAIVLCYVLLCYGGGFGTMPSFVLDVFGMKVYAVVYGTILTAWSAAGIVGPQIVALFKDNMPESAAYWSFITGACILTFGFLVSFLSSNKPFEN